MLFGFAAVNDYGAVMKSCVKRNWEEKVGVLATLDGKYHVCEYSDMDDELRRAKKDDTLTYRHGSVLIFAFSTKIFKEMKEKSASERGSDVYHKAFKKVSYWDGKELVTPENPNAYKFELFAQNFFRNVPIGNFGVIEVAREDDFAPVKNADFPIGQGIENDSPMSARNMLLAETTRWLLAAGFSLSEQAKNNIEISYLLSYRG